MTAPGVYDCALPLAELGSGRFHEDGCALLGGTFALRVHVDHANGYRAGLDGRVRRASTAVGIGDETAASPTDIWARCASPIRTRSANPNVAVRQAPPHARLGN